MKLFLSIVGVLLILTGLSGVIDGSVFSGIALIISGIIAFPMLFDKVNSLLEKPINSFMRGFFILGLLFIGGTIMSVNSDLEDEEKEKLAEFDRLPEAVKDSINKAILVKDSIEAVTKKIESGFSAWNGAHRNLEKMVKESMNDPESYEHVQTTYSIVDGNHLRVRTVFSGKNAFGGRVKNTVLAETDFDGRVIRIISQN